MTDELSIPLRSTENAFGLWRRVGILVWHGRVDPRVAHAFRRATIAHGRANPSGTAVIHLVESTSTVPETETRKVLADIPDDVRATTRLAVVVAEGDGMRGALVRGVTTGVSMLMRSRFPLKVVATVPEGAHLVTAELDRIGASCGTASELAAAVERVRAAVGTP